MLQFQCLFFSQAQPDLLGPPLSLSAAISVGAISVRLSVKFFSNIFSFSNTFKILQMLLENSQYIPNLQ